MHGTHLTADLYSCNFVGLMTDLEGLHEVCRRMVERAGLTIVGEYWHQFEASDGEKGASRAPSCWPSPTLRCIHGRN